MNHIEIQEKVKNNEAILIDVREDYEYEDRHIEGAKNLPLGTICEDNVKDLPKDKIIYTYCRSGARAENAKDILNSLGFNNVENIGGTIEWEENGGVLIK